MKIVFIIIMNEIDCALIHNKAEFPFILNFHSSIGLGKLFCESFDRIYSSDDALIHAALKQANMCEMIWKVSIRRLLRFLGKISRL